VINFAKELFFPGELSGVVYTERIRKNDVPRLAVASTSLDGASRLRYPLTPTLLFLPLLWRERIAELPRSGKFQGCAKFCRRLCCRRGQEIALSRNCRRSPEITSFLFTIRPIILTSMNELSTKPIYPLTHRFARLIGSTSDFALIRAMDGYTVWLHLMIHCYQ
jgi:hypothetical protein